MKVKIFEKETSRLVDSQSKRNFFPEGGKHWKIILPGLLEITHLFRYHEKINGVLEVKGGYCKRRH